MKSLNEFFDKKWPAADKTVGGYEFKSWHRPDDLRGHDIVFYDVIHTTVVGQVDTSLVIGVFLYLEDLTPDEQPPEDVRYRALVCGTPGLCSALLYAKSRHELPCMLHIPSEGIDEVDVEDTPADTIFD